ncbi:MAG: hypothetical protein FGM24_05540 [Candidatus Kapabacteria bacterium]|nr:hypothetical protein [Candidatus Kapabacteria bacterium]
MKQGIEHGVGRLDVTVAEEMTAHLEGHILHRVYGTFWACYHAEVAARRAIEPFFEEDDNAVGSALALQHHAMAPVGATLQVVATVDSVQGRRIMCNVKIMHGDRLIASGTQEQTLLPSTVIERKVRELYEAYGR